ncbi:MAG: hypothetical protein HZC54_02410 [Verrucomicrobia bacterium]|nr:hypothetical protein [Verrucomicrobiota bacterium]
MKRAIWILTASVALAAGLAHAQSSQDQDRPPVVQPVPTSELDGTILNISAGKITLWDGNESYIFLVDATTTCGPDNALELADLEVGEQVTVTYTWHRGKTLPTATHIEPAL